MEDSHSILQAAAPGSPTSRSPAWKAFPDEGIAVADEDEGEGEDQNAKGSKELWRLARKAGQRRIHLGEKARLQPCYHADRTGQASALGTAPSTTCALCQVSILNPGGCHLFCSSFCSSRKLRIFPLRILSPPPQTLNPKP